MTLNPKYGSIGLISYPYFWIVEGIGPLIELTGYLYVIVSFFLGAVYFEFAVLLALLFILYGSVFSMAAVLLESWSLNTYPKPKQLLRMVLLSLTEVFWYRPLSLVWRCEGILSFLRKRSEWGKMERKGLATKGSDE